MLKQVSRFYYLWGIAATGLAILAAIVYLIGESLPSFLTLVFDLFAFLCAAGAAICLFLFIFLYNRQASDLSDQVGERRPTSEEPPAMGNKLIRLFGNDEDDVARREANTAIPEVFDQNQIQKDLARLSGNAGAISQYLFRLKKRFTTTGQVDLLSELAKVFGKIAL